MIVAGPPPRGTRRFVLWGLLLADLLPVRLDLGRVRIERQSGERLRDLTRSRHQLLHPDPPDGTEYASGVPGDLTVRSRHVVWVSVDAADADAAHEEAVTRLLPPVLAALAIGAGGPVHAELLRIAEPDKTGALPEPQSPYSLSGFLTVREVGDLPATDTDRLPVLAAALAADGTAAAAGRELAQAFAMRPVTGGATAGLQAVLLRLFFVVEHVSRKAGYGRAEHTAVEDAQAQIVRGRSGA